MHSGLSKLAADISGAAVAGAIGGAVADAFGGGSGPVTGSPNGLAFNFTAEPQRERFDDAFSALAYADPAKKPAARSFDRMWSAWADVRGTGWDGSGVSSGVDGKQLNLTAGIGRRLSPDFLFGIVGGY